MLDYPILFSLRKKIKASNILQNQGREFMAIRYTGQHSDSFLEAARRYGLLATCRTRPVSYTHLDVYKRQEMTRSKIQPVQKQRR